MNTSKESLLQAMEAYFQADTRRINHARRVTEYAEELLSREGGDYLVVIGAAVLHDIGIHQAEKKYGSTAGKYQEKEGPPIACRILTESGFQPDKIEEICEIIAHHHSPGKVNTTNFKILYDADWFVNIQDEYDISDRKKLQRAIGKIFLTTGGRVLAEKTYLK